MQCGGERAPQIIKTQCTSGAPLRSARCLSSATLAFQSASVNTRSRSSRRGCASISARTGADMGTRCAAVLCALRRQGDEAGVHIDFAPTQLADLAAAQTGQPLVVTIAPYRSSASPCQINASSASDNSRLRGPFLIARPVRLPYRIVVAEAFHHRPGKERASEPRTRLAAAGPFPWAIAARRAATVRRSGTAIGSECNGRHSLTRWRCVSTSERGFSLICWRSMNCCSNAPNVSPARTRVGPSRWPDHRPVELVPAVSSLCCVLCRCRVR